METAKVEVLTLHRDVMARVASADSLVTAERFVSSVAKAERMISRLAGMNGALRGFSERAWAMAGAIAGAPALCSHLGMAARILRLDELAELIQVVLEEEVTATDGAWLGGRSPSQRSFDKGVRGRVAPRLAAQGTRAPTRPPRMAVQGAVRTGTFTAQIALKRAVQRAIQEMRSGLAVAGPTRGARQMEPTGVWQAGPSDPNSPEWARVARTGVAEDSLSSLPQASAQSLARFRAAGHLSTRHLDSSTRSARAANAGKAAAVDWVASAADIGRSRACRRDESALDRALLTVGGVDLSEPVATRLPIGADRAAPQGPQLQTARLRPPRRALTAAIERAATSESRQLAVHRLASPATSHGQGGRVRRAPPDPSMTRLAAVLPRWLHTLAAWTDADAAPSRLLGLERHPGEVPRMPSVHVRVADERVHLWLGPGEAPAGARVLSVPAAADLPRWLFEGAQASETARRRTGAAGTTGLQAKAAMEVLADRHGGGAQGIATTPPSQALAHWRTPPTHLGAQAMAPTPLAAVAAGGADRASDFERGVRAQRPGPPRVRSWTPAVAAAMSTLATHWWAGQTVAGERRARGHSVLDIARDGGPIPGVRFVRPQRVLGGHSDLLGSSLDAATKVDLVASGETMAWLSRADSVDHTPSVGSGAATGSAAPATQRMLASGLTGAMVPAAVRAALGVFGESTRAAPDRSAVGAYLARFYGRAPPSPSRRTSAEMPTAQLRMPEAAAPATRVGHASSVLDATAEPLLRGMAALDALLAGPAAADAPAGDTAHRQTRIAAAAPTLLTPAAVAFGTEVTSAGTTAGSARSSARLHGFSPAGLGRGRNLFSRGHAGRPSRSAPLSPRATNARPSGAASSTALRASRPGGIGVGYGAAALGGGELIGLGPDDVHGFFGEIAPAPSGLRGADALAHWITARRMGTSLDARGSVAATSSRDGGAGALLAPAMAGFDASGEILAPGPRNIPASFNFHQAPGDASAYDRSPQATLIDVGGTVARHAQALARSTGPTASGRATQASVMARVLSVTDAPTGNMLPLVAPAAHALVAAAAAKPQSEHIVTSGYGPSQATATQSIQRSDRAARRSDGPAHGHDVEDVDVLAARIARSVLLRLQRERERRGHYG